MQIYLKMREEILSVANKQKDEEHKRKMAELDAKIKKLELIQNEREEKQR